MSIFNWLKKSKEPNAVMATHQNEVCSQPAGTSSPEEEAEKEANTESKAYLKEERNVRIHNLLILDESGSMSSIYKPALSGVNETLQTIRNAQSVHPGQEHFVTLIAFDTIHYNQIYCNTPAKEVMDITEKQYRPAGGTPLYDAMGRSINDLSMKVAEGDVVLVTVITDGYENASCEYDVNSIKKLVEAMKAKGWVFTYIGANQDVEAVSASMSIDNRLAFDADEESTCNMFIRESRSRKRFFGRLNRNFSRCDLSSGYFEEDDEEG